MTPEELRADIPALDEAVYLNTGATGPCPRRVLDAAAAAGEDHEVAASAGVDGRDPYKHAWSAYDETRATIADFLGADPEEVALTQNTASGISAVVNALELSAGDVVLQTDCEHPAVSLPWDRLTREVGIEVRELDTDRGGLDPAEVADAVAEATVLSFSAVDWLYGTRAPVAELVAVAHEHDTFVLVDAVQAPGQFPVDVTEWGADAVAAAGHKWLLGPWGAGFLYVDNGVVDDLTPGRVGYRSVEDTGAAEFEWANGAARFEIGTANLGPHAGLQESMAMLESIGLDTVEERIRDLTDHLKSGVPEGDLLSPRGFESGLVTVEVEDPDAAVDRLAEEDVLVRSVPAPEGALRVSVHAFNTREDLDELLAAMDV